jgi:hypothetical protein
MSKLWFVASLVGWLPFAVTAFWPYGIIIMTGVFIPLDFPVILDG